MSKLKTAVLNTLVYSDHFNFPLTLDELHSRLIGVRATRSQLAQSLDSLLKHKLIGQSSPYYHLPGRSQLAKLRRIRYQTSQHSLAALTRLLSRLTPFPGILAVFLTGALAVNNSDPGDDFDLLIVTAPGRLWTTRLLLTFYTQLLGLRRTPHESRPAGKLCLNLYLDTSSFLLPASRQNLYTAYELIQIKPLYDPHHLYPQLLAANSWLSKYLPNYRPPQPLHNHTPFSSSPFLLPFEKLAYLAQRYYMKSKITRELVTPHAAFFHPLNPGRSVLRKLNNHQP